MLVSGCFGPERTVFYSISAFGDPSVLEGLTPAPKNGPSIPIISGNPLHGMAPRLGMFSGGGYERSSLRRASSPSKREGPQKLEHSARLF